MRAILFALFLLPGTLRLTAQTAPAETAPSPGRQNPVQTPNGSPKGNEAQRSVIEVKPGEEAIKNKDLWEKTGYFHPFRRMGRFVLTDQKNIWTSPFHTAKSDIKWWAILGGATGALIATDKLTSPEFPNNSTWQSIGNKTSAIGAAYTLIPIASGFYFLGTAKGSEHFRETGLLCFEALIDSTIVETVIKSATDRARPLEGDGTGQFWQSTGPPWNAGFPSGHAINTFALASVFAHEYHNKLWVKIAAYGYAIGVVGARLAARKHFPGDVVAGGAMGWFIGDYVYAKRHNTELDARRSISQRILDHVHFNVAFE
jgi:membrane-associated phospholipid phosphatase